MSREALWDRVRMAWAMLAGRSARTAPEGRIRVQAPPRRGDEPQLEAAGFVEEALPWLDAVYRFALRLSEGDADRAEDVVQETFLRAHRFWHTFRRGSNARSWLFTICRNVHLQDRLRASRKWERTESQLEVGMDVLPLPSPFASAPGDPEADLAAGQLADEVVEAIDALPPDFRDVLVLSDLGDLTYAEIAEVLDLPRGTVKSRLFRARRQLQERLRGFAERAGYIEEAAP